MASIVKDIPIHKLRSRAACGVDVVHFLPGDVPKALETLGVHRDDHYLFFLLKAGSASLMIDFNEIAIPQSSLYYILPGQVHHRIRNDVAEGWFIAVDTLLVSPDYRNVFENQLILQQPYNLTEHQLQQNHTLLSLLKQKHQESDETMFYLPVLHSLLQSFLGTVAACYNRSHNIVPQLSRQVQLSQQFKKLLTENIRTLKSPTAYSAKLNVTETYLNEVVKKTTGFPISYWILQEVIVEAKRLLYYSELNVKQIAHTLGYQDHAYFSRIFSKSVGKTPLTFRLQHHK